MAEVSPVDAAIGAILAVALARGLFIGLIREAFSVAALGAACIAVRAGTGPASAWLAGEAGIAGSVADWVAGTAIAIGTVIAVVVVGRILKRGVRGAGLGWADRLGGAVLGAAEGALVVTVALLAATWAGFGDHPALADSRGVETFAQLQGYVMERAEGLPDVASPPP